MEEMGTMCALDVSDESVSTNIGTFIELYNLIDCFVGGKELDLCIVYLHELYNIFF